MSGVNRNILGNNSIPVLGEGPTNIELVTTTGSRWVMLNFPATFLSSSNGGSCTGITLQWTPDPSLGFEDASTYYAVTESTLFCEPYSLNPLTASIAYEQFIDSSYTEVNNGATYYMRAYQTKVGGYRGPYSDIVSINTKGNEAGLVPGTYIFDTENYDPTNGLWYAYDTSGSSGLVGAWTGSTMPEVIKYGGPNYDAIRTNGATLYIPMAGNMISGTPFQGSVGLANGSIVLQSAPGAIAMAATAMTSSTGTDNGTNTITCQTTGYMRSGENTFNKVIGFYGGGGTGGNRNGYMTLDGANVSTGGVGGRIYTTAEVDLYGNTWIQISTSADCVLRCFTWGVQYPADTFHTKYGPAGEAYPPTQLSVTGSSVLPIPSSSAVNLYSGFGYPTTTAYNNLILTTASLNPTGDLNFSYQITNSGSGWYDMNQISSKIIQITGSLTSSSIGLGFNGTTDNITVLSSSLAGIQNDNYTVQFIGTLPSSSIQLSALFGNPNYIGATNEDVIYRNDILPTSTSIDFRVNAGTAVSVSRYDFPTTSSLQMITFMSSGSTFKVYNGLQQLTAVTDGANPNFTGSFNLFDNMVANGRGVYFGYNGDVDTNNYSGSLHNLTFYSRSLSDSELSASYQYFQSL